MGFEDRIFYQATRGTTLNPGLPPTLASLLIAQAQHETGNFTSNIFRNYNNAFGYSFVPGARYQVGAGSIADNGQPVAAYRNIEDSTKEVVDWIYRRVAEGVFPKDLNTIVSPEQYAALLKKAGYYQDSVANYTAGIKAFFKQVMQYIEQPGSGAWLLFGGLIFYWWYRSRLRKRW